MRLGLVCLLSFATMAAHADNLNEILPKAVVPAGRVVLTVQADRAIGDASRLADKPTLGQIETAFKRKLGDFGPVIGDAPATSTRVVDPPRELNAFDGVDPREAFHLLVGLLSREQYDRLTSSAGLRLADLKNADQRALFRAIIAPTGKTMVADLRLNAVPKPGPLEEISNAPEISALRLGLAQTVQVPLPERPGVMGAFLPSDEGIAEAINARKTLEFTRTEVVPTRPKPSQLPREIDALRKPVTLASPKTVGEFVDAIRAQTHFNVHADVRYAAQPLRLDGEARTARASEWLDALAFALDGAYRNVGGIFILTNDIIGLGAREELWRRYSDASSAARREYLAQADKRMAESIQAQPLPFHSEESRMPQSQIDAASKQKPGISPIEWHTRFSELNQAQQRIALEELKVMSDGKIASAEPNMDVKVHADPYLEVLVPGRDKPLLVMNGGEFIRAILTGRGLSTISQIETKPFSLKEALTHQKEHALRIALCNVGDPKRLAEQVKAIGFEQFWLSASIADIGSPKVATIVRSLRAVGVRPMLVLSPFEGEANSPEEWRDRDVLGEASNGDFAMHVGDPKPKGRFGYIAPFGDAASERFAKISDTAAALPALGGFVFERTAPPGYQTEPSAATSHMLISLGYTLLQRQVFLLNAGCDPLDVDPSTSAPALNIDLPQWSERNEERKLGLAWDKWRAALNADAIRRLLDMITPSKRIYLEQRHAFGDNGVWYGEMTSSGALLVDEMATRGRSLNFWPDRFVAFGLGKPSDIAFLGTFLKPTGVTSVVLNVNGKSAASTSAILDKLAEDVKR